MTETLFLTLAAVLFALFIALGWRLLPGDRFQVLASLPQSRRLSAGAPTVSASSSMGRQSQ